MRLFLFPFAGGGPPAFRVWPSKVPDHIETWIVHYPGRGSRHNEAPIKELATLVEKIHQTIQPLLDKPFALFGHSLGGLVAYELTRTLLQKKLLQPNALFVSACGAPHLPDPHPPLHTLPDPEFLTAMQELNGTPAEVENHPELLEILLPTLRADFEIVEGYHYISNDLPLKCPIVAFGGLEDLRVSRKRIEGWALHTDDSFKAQYFPGDHFFINTARDAVIATIVSELTAAHAKN